MRWYWRYGVIMWYKQEFLNLTWEWFSLVAVSNRLQCLILFLLFLFRFSKLSSAELWVEVFRHSGHACHKFQSEDQFDLFWRNIFLIRFLVQKIHMILLTWSLSFWDGFFFRFYGEFSPVSSGIFTRWLLYSLFSSYASSVYQENWRKRTSWNRFFI